MQNIYDLLGGQATIAKIVHAFYPRVQQDALLAPLFPDDLTDVMEKQCLFLTQFFGGPSLYSDIHGHPMMRARHGRFRITPDHATAWLLCMQAALQEVIVDEDVQHIVLERLQGPAYFFVNDTP